VSASICGKGGSIIISGTISQNGNVDAMTFGKVNRALHQARAYSKHMGRLG
jgi:hypothetical protein